MFDTFINGHISPYINTTYRHILQLSQIKNKVNSLEASYIRVLSPWPEKSAIRETR